MIEMECMKRAGVLKSVRGKVLKLELLCDFFHQLRLRLTTKGSEQHAIVFIISYITGFWSISVVVKLAHVVCKWQVHQVESGR